MEEERLTTQLVIRKVSRNIGSAVAVKDASMIVEPGDLRAVIGPNGEGKAASFSIAVLRGLVAPSSRGGRGS